jgi:hypothetical protein
MKLELTDMVEDASHDKNGWGGFLLHSLVIQIQRTAVQRALR